MIKLLTFFRHLATLSLKPVVEWWRLPRFPAKMTLVHWFKLMKYRPRSRPRLTIETSLHKDMYLYNIRIFWPCTQIQLSFRPLILIHISSDHSRDILGWTWRRCGLRGTLQKRYTLNTRKKMKTTLRSSKTIQIIQVILIYFESQQSLFLLSC